jgi:Saxitoxin biosynthesis operon protein SxtJ
MLQEDIRALLSAKTRDFRKFGLLVGGVFCLLGLWFYLRHKHFYWWMLVPGVPLLTLGAVLPRSLKWIYVGWMIFAMTLGMIVSTIILTLLFYLVVTPTGLIARAIGKDFLSQRLDRNGLSYWIARDTSSPKQKHEHEQQF